MAVLQKNDSGQTPEQEPLFDGAITEECNQFKECGDFAPYLADGKPVLNAEYKLKKKPLLRRPTKPPGSWARDSTWRSTASATNPASEPPSLLLRPPALLPSRRAHR